MKYNEAIDMILDGGEAYTASISYYKYFFKDARLHSKFDGDTSDRCEFITDYFTENDWIVEKDGVVYKEYVNEEERKEQGICAICLKTHKRFACAQNKLEELKEIGKRLTAGHGIEFAPSSMFSIDEDWLEAKMLCFMKRLGVATIYKQDYEEDEIDDLSCNTIENIARQCSDDNCQFCFSSDHIPDAGNMVENDRPEHKQKETILLADKAILYTCTHGTYPCEECYEKYKKENHSEQPREKVTIECIVDIVKYLCEEANALLYSDDVFHLIKFRTPYEDLVKKLEYLVSLQGD